jgi:hypothetical protein
MAAPAQIQDSKRLPIGFLLVVPLVGIVATGLGAVVII